MYQVHACVTTTTKDDWQCVVQVPTFFVWGIDADNALLVARKVVDPHKQADCVSLSITSSDRSEYVTKVWGKNE